MSYTCVNPACGKPLPAPQASGTSNVMESVGGQSYRIIKCPKCGTENRVPMPPQKGKP